MASANWVCSATRVAGCTVLNHSASAGADTGVHCVEEPVLAFALAGACATNVAHRQVEAVAGTAWVEPAAERRRNLAGPKGARLFSVSLTVDNADGLFADFRDLFAQPAVIRDRYARLDALRALAEFRRGSDTLTSVAMLGHALTMLARLARAKFTDEKRGVPPWLSTVRDFVHEHYRGPLDLVDVARVGGVTPAHLARTFRAHFGVPLGDYARGLRVIWAADQIRQGELSLAAVSISAGFFDQSHFSREFRRHFGMTPTQYRRLHR